MNDNVKKTSINCSMLFVSVDCIRVMERAETAPRDSKDPPQIVESTTKGVISY